MKDNEIYEDMEAKKTADSVGAMSTKYMDLMKKYGFVMAQINHQNDIAFKLEQMKNAAGKEQTPIEDLIMIPNQPSLNASSAAQANIT